ncbi:Signal transduction response regulator [Macleaya cordata]|uniref:Signal transduction response regulator n=1 Tax=Macleaya cordata TaxID=56857 RepID=A0A200QP34_MACCD|nr:Signal transduction response regulator [Macleaya cordata]
MDRREESFMEKDVVGAGSNIPFVDRSKVRILLCDNNSKSSNEVFTLLCKCSYQVTSVKTPRQVIDALNAEGPDIDIILSEVDLPMAKGLKMLKYLMRDKELQRIPIIMMSAQDDVSVVVKCLRRGAADYLVKPLRTNELLNLWTHMWRRRHMLGLVEKNILNYDFDLVASDPSDPNTNSTTLFSDDTDEKSRRSTVPEMTNCWKDDFSAATFVEPPVKDSSKYQLDVPGPSDQRIGQISAFFKKSELKVGKSSAFFTYVKSSVTRNNSSRVGCMNENTAKVEESSRKQKLQACDKQLGADVRRQETQVSWENYCTNGFPSSDNGPGITNVERSCTPPMPLENPDGRNSKEEQPSTVLLHPRNEAQVDVSGGQALTPLPYYVPGMMNQVMMPSPSQLYQGNPQDLPKNSTSSMLAPYNPLQQHANVPGMSSYPYYPICVQQGQMPTTHMWPSIASTPSNEAKPTQFERREAALIKFRQKRKDRCFDKKIRYINRKKLAERRPRVKGQFVRRANSVGVDLNDQPAAVDDSDGDEEEDVDE